MLMQSDATRNEAPVEAAQSPQEFRTTHESIPEFRFTSTEMTVQLLDNPRRGLYTFTCILQATGDEITDRLTLDVPAEGGEIKGFKAWDSVGGLEEPEVRSNGKAAQLVIRFRSPISNGNSYRFSYSYETALPAIVAKGAFSQTITYNGGAVFQIQCDNLRIDVCLPANSTVIDARPPAQRIEDEDSPPILRYEVTKLRSLEPFSYLIGYQRRGIGAQAYLWVAGAVGTGLVGLMITKVLEAL